MSEELMKKLHKSTPICNKHMLFEEFIEIQPFKEIYKQLKQMQKIRETMEFIDEIHPIILVSKLLKVFQSD